MFNVSRARKIQQYLAKKVLIEDRYGIINKIACVDAAYDRNKVFAVAALFHYPSSEMINYVVINDIANIPYIPGLLAFREAPFYIKALNKLGLDNIDLIIVDGHGIAHPRKLGIAAHVGVVLSKPTIGVAKKKLYGIIKIINGKKYIVDPVSGDKLGVVLSARGKNIFISPGNLISIESAYNIIKRLTKKHSLPEPLYITDKLTKMIKHGKDVDINKIE